MSVATIVRTRARLGIVAAWRRDLDAIGREETLRRIRARSKAGEPMRQGQVRNQQLLALCRRFFGGWYQAAEAAGLRAEGKPRGAATKPSSPKPLTDRLLRNAKPSAELERITGVPRSRIKSRRASLGIERDERQEKDRSWIAPVRHLLGKLPDPEIARRVGKPKTTVHTARTELGIARTPNPSKAIADARARFAALRPAELRRVLTRMSPIDAAIMRDRILADRPATLAQIGGRFGVSRQRVAQRERGLGRSPSSK